MPRFAVLLRGVNVGKANRIAMADFRSLLEGLGYTDVRTLLNSGNAVFSSPGRSAGAHGKAVRAALLDGPGLDVPVVVESSAEFLKVVDENPFEFGPDEHSRVLVAFGQEAGAVKGLSAISQLVEPPEHFRITRRVAYLHCASGIRESRAAIALLGKVGRAVTTRNWATVLKLAGLLGD